MTDNEWLLDVNVMLYLDELYVFSERVGKMMDDGIDEESARIRSLGYFDG
jgi:hypothetical protein